MNNLEKSRFIAESTLAILNRHVKRFRKTKAKTIDSILEEEDYEIYRGIVKSAVADVLKLLEAWEQTELEELEGMSPKQYIESLSSASDIIELVAEMYEKNGGMLSNYLVERVKSLGAAFEDELLAFLESVGLERDKSLDARQKAAVRIVEMLASVKFMDVLEKILLAFDPEETEEESFELVTVALGAMGGPAVELLVRLVEKDETRGPLYVYALSAIGNFTSKNKSQKIYSFLKECFRKSEKKMIESVALALYGDGRAIPAIRGFVEKNMDDISPRAYSVFRKAVQTLGGSMADLDGYFGDEDECDEYEEE